MKRCDRKGSMQRLMTPIVWIWDTGTRLPAISDVLQRWRAPRQTEISVSPVIFESFVTQGGDSWKILLFWWMEQHLARHIISEYYPVSTLKFSLFFFLLILCYARGSMIRFIVPNFSKSFYENARETGWFIHLKAVLIEKNFAFGLYSD